MADPFAEFERELEQQGLQQPGGIPVTPQQTGTPSTLKSVKGDPFARLQTELEQPYSGMNALTGGYIRDIPVVGPTIESAAQNVAADIRSRMSGTPKEEELKTVQDYATRALAGNPGLAAAGGLAGNAATFGALGATSLGARALGATGGNLAARSATGAATGAALGAADAAARGEDPAAGAVIGGLAQGAAPSFGGFIRSILSPFNTETQSVAQVARQPAISTLQQAGVPLSAGEVTGSRYVRGLENILRDYPGIGGRVRDATDLRDLTYTSSVLKKAGIPTSNGLASPLDLDTHQKNLSRGFETVAARNVVDVGTPAFQRDLTKALDVHYQNMVPADEARFNKYVGEFQKYAQTGTPVPGEVYQATRSALTNTMNSATDGNARTAFKNLRTALDNAMQSSLPPQDALLFKELQQRWGMLRTVQEAMSGTGERTSQGFLDPKRLATAIRGRGTMGHENYASGRGGELADMARAGSAIMQPLPESGTGRQVLQQGQLGSIAAHLAGGAAIGGGIGGVSDVARYSQDPQGGAGVGGAVTGAALGLAAPYAFGRVIHSPVGQAYLRNTLLSSPAATRAISGPLQEAFLPARLPKTLRDLGE